MLRSTTLKRIVSPHPVMPGRAVERGYLYRSTRQNRYCQLANISQTQRSWMEELKWHFTLFPDVMNCMVLGTVIVFTCLFSGSFNVPFGWNFNKNHTHSGGLNQSELQQRNAEMGIIFQNHRNVAEEMRSRAGIEGPHFTTLAPTTQYTPLQA